MRPIFTLLMAVLITSFAHAQTKKDTILWGFPITDYFTPLNDSTIVVQVKLPATVKFEDKQFGLLRGIYRENNEDTGRKGFGRCNLIKGDYNYFSIKFDKGKAPKKDDLIYTNIKLPAGGYQSPLFFCAAHNITFLSVTDSAFYNPEKFLIKRTEVEDNIILFQMEDDIHYTGKYFKENSPAMNKAIDKGAFSGSHVLDEMIKTKIETLKAFLLYVRVHNIIYSGNRWKISETFATWLVNGAPGL